MHLSEGILSLPLNFLAAQCVLAPEILDTEN